MAGSGSARVFYIPRSANQLEAPECVPLPRHGTLVAHASAPQPEGLDDVGTNHAIGGGLPAAPACPTSLAQHPLCRQTPEVGARCVNCARRDLCGGRPEMGVPTAIRA